MKENKFCTGCGLCKSVLKCEMKRTENGYQYPNNLDMKFEKKYCFFENECSSNMGSSYVWGKINHVYLGYSNDKKIRNAASSGGVLTAICLFLLKNKIVDAIIQTRVDDRNPLKTITTINKSADDVMKCMGSRYTISEPLNNILELLEKGKKYAFVGKPCDVAVLRNYMNSNSNDCIKYYLSFFCAGIPSYKANINLVNSMGFDETKIKELNYRGNGWPGMAICSDGIKTNSMSYEESWGEILGRDINYICRFCSDGIGEAADIACGDAWYIDSTGKKPTFDEAEGRNVVFSRNEKGTELLIKMKKENLITLTDYENYINELKIIQKFQYLRRTTLFDVLKTLKLFGKPVPNYNMKKLKTISKNVPIKYKLKRRLGIIKRIINKRI